MAIITARCVQTFLDVFDVKFIISFLGCTSLMLIYHKIVRSMIIYIVYGTIIVCFCCRNGVHNSRIVFRLEERENARRIENNPDVIENNPIHII